MFKKILSVVLLLAALSVSFPQLVKVSFYVHSIPLPDSQSIYIVGNHEEIGGWIPNKALLNKVSDSLWSVTKQFPKGTSLEFKFTQGTWETERLEPDGSTPKNSTLVVKSDTALYFTATRFANSFGTRTIIGKITGTVAYHKNFEFKGLASRNVIVWLPKEYEAEPTRRFPVIYMHDGQNLFDPATASFGVDWQADETADSLIRLSKTEPIIMVGIYSSAERMQEYIPGEKSKLYMQGIVNSLKPFIDKTYRTKPQREYTATWGSSAGGTISFMLSWHYPNVFSKAACFSPALQINRDAINFDLTALVKEHKGAMPDVKYYFDNGGVGLEAILQPGIEEMIEALKAKGFVEGKQFISYFDINAEHSESAWAKRVWRPLIFFFGN